MKHSAKAAARRARERSPQERRRAGRRRAGSASLDQPSARRTRAPRATASRVGTAAAGRADHQRMAQLPYAVVLAGTAAGLVLMQVAKDAVRSGTLVIAGALLAGSLTRLVLPEGRAGLLGSRRRLVDVALLTALGVGLLTAGLIVKVPG